MPRLRIVADENIPRVPELFGDLGEVCLLPGRSISREALRGADVLLVRSVTGVDRHLLEGTGVRFVGSATIGTDHVDMELLETLGIVFAHAPGSNAESVVEYVLAALTSLAARRGDVLRAKKVGIVGCGNIGGRLSERLAAMGCTILKNDPPLADEADRRGLPHDFLPLRQVLRESDVVSLHVPLVRNGRYQTRRLLGDEELRTMKEGAWLVNTSRGDVVDGGALKSTIHHLGAVVLDVWEGEPSPDPDLVDRVELATPHIAGYSYDGKIAGTRMLLEALCAFLQADTPPEAVEMNGRITLAAPDPGLSETDWLDEVVRQMYAISRDDARMRERTGESWANHFARLRREYPIRRRFSLHVIGSGQVPAAYRTAAESALRVCVRDYDLPLRS